MVTTSYFSLVCLLALSLQTLLRTTLAIPVDLDILFTSNGDLVLLHLTATPIRRESFSGDDVAIWLFNIAVMVDLALLNVIPLGRQGGQLEQPLNPPDPGHHTALPMTTWVSAVNHTPRHHLPITTDSPEYEL